MERIMKNKENISATVYKKIRSLTESVRNCLISILYRIKNVFWNNPHTKGRPLLPAGNNNHLLEKKTERDFYAVPVRICRKSL